MSSMEKIGNPVMGLGVGWIKKYFMVLIIVFVLVIIIASLVKGKK
jgi:hypothetical protein